MMRRMPVLPSSPLLTSLCGVQHRVRSGRLGTVYRATHLETDRPVALRVLSEPGNGDHGLRLAWWREARQAAGLRHPNVAAVYRAGAIQRSEEGLTPFPVGSLWLASEWLEGPALSSQRLAFADVVPIVSSLLRALAHLHARGFRHGAVRARNLRCSTAGGGARLCDMGMDRIDALVVNLERLGFEAIALTPSGGERLANFSPGLRTAVLLGAEGPGLAPGLIARTRSVRIPMAPDFDSLNVATTSGIVLHHLASRPEGRR